MQPNQDNNVVENKEVIQQKNTTESNPVTPAQTETPEQINWKKFREQRDIDRKQKEAFEKKAAEKAAEVEALKSAMDALLNKPAVNPSNNNNYEEEETEDHRIDKKVKAALEQERRKNDEERRIREQAEFPQKLTSAYSDFNQVCSVDNLDYLEYHYPEVATPFKHMPDGFDKWAAVYKAVKRFVVNTDSKKDQKKAEQNFNKPQSMSVAGVTQTGDTAPMQLDDKRRSDNWARMQKVMKGGK